MLHSVCSDKERDQILEKYNATLKEMPKISINDAVLTSLKVKVGSFIKIEREDPVTGTVYFYRVVVDE